MPDLANVKLGLPGIHQVQNAKLAVALAQKFLERHESTVPSTNLPAAFMDGLKNAKWPGRCQTVLDPQYASTTWFLDGAHTVESLDCCMQWFASSDAAFRPAVAS